MTVDDLLATVEGAEEDLAEELPGFLGQDLIRDHFEFGARELHIEGDQASDFSERDDQGLYLVGHRSSRADQPRGNLGLDMSDDQIWDQLVTDEPGEIIVCGASHVPFDRELDGARVINVGSVGEVPGGGVAHATIIGTTPLGIFVNQFYVPLAE